MWEAATICPGPLQVDFWPFDLESGVRVTCDLVASMPILVFLGLSVLDLGPTYATDLTSCLTDRHDVRRTSSLNAPAVGKVKNSDNTLFGHSLLKPIFKELTTLYQLLYVLVVKKFYHCCFHFQCWWVTIKYLRNPEKTFVECAKAVTALVTDRREWWIVGVSCQRRLLFQESHFQCCCCIVCGRHSTMANSIHISPVHQWRKQDQILKTRPRPPEVNKGTWWI